jgi:hypothetical protein
MSLSPEETKVRNATEGRLGKPKQVMPHTLKTKVSVPPIAQRRNGK